MTGACDLLGIDPLYVANEGKVLAVVAPDEADAALRRMARPSARSRRHPHRRDRGRAGRHRRPAHDLRRDAHRRHAGGRPPSADLLSHDDPYDRLRVTGTVQGVGFRPFVFRHAVALGLAGCVLNDIARRAHRRRRCARADRRAHPPGAGRGAAAAGPRVVRDRGGCTTGRREPGSGSSTATTPAQRTSRSASTPRRVADCLAEVDDPADRRYGYPFTNCTNCGPRYTIVLGVPYDRPATTMAGFAHVRRVPGRVRRPRRSPLPRPAQRLPRRAARSCPGAMARRRRSRRVVRRSAAAVDALQRGEDPRREGHRRLPPGRRRHRRRGRGRAAATQGSRRQALRGDGPRRGRGGSPVRARRGAPSLRSRRRASRSCSHRDGPAQTVADGWRPDLAGARAPASVQPAPPPHAPGGRSAAGDDQRQPQRRADRPRRRRRRRPARPAGRRAFSPTTVRSTSAATTRWCAPPRARPGAAPVPGLRPRAASAAVHRARARSSRSAPS